MGQTSIDRTLDDSKIWRDLLQIREVIRDPVHKDIELTAFELDLINQPEFLRLIDVRQLGMTYLVYPGAVHNRFLHSIGTLHIAQQMINNCNRNAERYHNAVPIDDYSQFVIRLSSLLHDVAHVPFGHTLEEEMNLFPSQWKDKKRRDVILGQGSKLIEHVSTNLSKSGLAQFQIEKVLDDVENVLTENTSAMETPFIYDVVNNTICADLIDYVYRDILFTGLNQQFGDRFIRYLAVLPIAPIDDDKGRFTDEFCLDPQLANARYMTNGGTALSDDGHREFVRRGIIRNEEKVRGPAKKRLVLLLYQYHKGRRRVVTAQSALSEAIDLVRQRYSLAEKVYFHRTKNAASAMIGSSVAASSLTTPELFGMGDLELLRRLKLIEGRSALLAQKVSERKLYRPIFERRNFPEFEGSDREFKTLRGVAERFRDKTERLEFETMLEQTLGLPAGSVVVYCPSREMNLKDFRMLVQETDDSRIKPLERSLTPWRQSEMEAIKSNHKDLWRFQVLVDKELANPDDGTSPLTQKIAGLVASSLELTNGIAHLRQYWVGRDELLADLAIEAFHEKDPKTDVTVDEREQLIKTSRRGESTVDSLVDELRRWRASKRQDGARGS